MNLINKNTGQVIASDILSIDENGAHGADFMLPGNFLETHDLVAHEKIVSDEQRAFEVRADRNAKLTASDWTQVADAPVDKEAWSAYRQALRDITGQEGFPWTITWPTQPV